MSNRKSKEQVIKLIKKHIRTNFDNNQSKAAEAWGDHRNVVYEVLANRRNPTKKMLATLGLKKDSTTFYVSAEQEI